MPRISLDSDIHPMSEFRSNFSSFIDQIHKTKRPIVITQHGRSSAVLMDVSQYEKMVDKLEMLDDIERATRELGEGKGISQSNAKRHLKGRLAK